MLGSSFRNAIEVGFWDHGVQVLELSLDLVFRTQSGSSFVTQIKIIFQDAIGFGFRDQDQGWVLRLGMGSIFDIQSKG